MRLSLSPIVLAGLCLASGAGASVAHAVAPAPTYALIRSISLLGNDGWDYLSTDSAAHRLYVSRGTHVDVVDTQKGTLVGEIPNTEGVHGIAIAPDLNRGFTSNGRANTVTVFDLTTLKTLQTVTVDAGPDCILYDPATLRVFTFNGKGQSATAIDGATGKVLATIPLGGRPEFAVADGRGHIYDNLEDKSAIVTLNSKSLKVERTDSLAPAQGPSGVAMDRKNDRLFPVCSDKSLPVVDAKTGKVVTTLVIGNGADAAAFDPELKLVFSPNGRDGTVSIYQELTPNTYTLTATLSTQEGARTMALDEATHHIFLADAKALPRVPGATGRRRSYEPGSFVILEYGPVTPATK